MNTTKSFFSKYLLALFIAGVSAGAIAQETPAILEGVIIVDADRAQQMMRAGTQVFDVRVAAEYAEAHIKGAQSLPYREKSAKATNFDKTQDNFDLKKLPANKNAPLIFYCNAGDCWKSYKASKVAVEAGYKHVHWFRGGLPEWRARKLPVD